MLLRLALLALLIALIPQAEAQYGVPLNCDVPQHNGDCALYGISLVQLLANPEKYDGSHVRVIGFIHFEPDNNAIYLHKEDEQLHLRKNGFWVSLAEGVSSDGCQDSYALIEGVYRARNTGRTTLWSGAITRVTKCQLVSPAP
jgi:hypothetical protein